MQSSPVPVSIVYAFTNRGTGGNPAGVVLDADQLTLAQKQQVAAQVGLSETAFVSRSTSADFKLEFFTPNRQIAHCGHATIATFSLLVQRGRLMSTTSSKETVDGRREILLDGDRVYMEQRAPRYTPLEQTTVTRTDVLQAVNVRAEDLLMGHDPMVVNTGNSFLLVPLKADAIVRSIQADQQRLLTISDALDLVGIYPFSLEVSEPGRHAAARMFGPRYGIREEAATGMAAGPLGAYLHDVLGLNATPLLIEQGGHMSPPSLSELEVRLQTDEGGVRSLMVGGWAREADVIQIEVN